MKNKFINFILISILFLVGMLPWCNVCAEGIEVNRNIISGVELLCDGDNTELVLDISGSAGIIGFAVERMFPENDKYALVTVNPFQMFIPFGSAEKTIGITDSVVAGETYFYRITAHDNAGREILCGTYDVVAKEVLGVEGGQQAAPDVSALSERSPYRLDMSVDAVDVSGLGTVINICVTNDGLFTVSASNIAVCLSALSLPDAVDAISQTNFALTCRGESVSWQAGDNNESLLFYGSTTSSLYQVGNIYQLRVGTGNIITQELLTTAVVTNGQSFFDNIYFEKDFPGYFTKGESRLPPLDDFWIWDYWWNSGGVKTFALELPDVDVVSQSGVIITQLKGYHKEDYVVSNNHVRISCNGVLVSDMYFTGWDKILVHSVVTNLVNGINIISIEQVLDTGNTSIFFLESIDAGYTRQFHAHNDALILDGGPYSNVTVSGFSTNMIMLFDVTDERFPVQLSGGGIDVDTNGLFSISYIPQDASNTYLATIVPLEVASMYGVEEVDLLSITNEADYVVLTISEFMATAQALIDQRKAQGLKTMLLDVAQVYDIFADGFVTPAAIKDFLSYAYNNWDISPRYVVLAGAGNWDFLDKQQDDPSDPCLIPPLMYYMDNVNFPGWIGVDTPFGDTEGDIVPEIIVGRLPAGNVTILTNIISKIIAYEEQSNSGWKNTVALLADNGDLAGDFHGDSDILATLVPASRPLEKIYLTNSSYTVSVRAAIVNRLNAGTGVLSYLGHGNSDKVAAEDLINNVAAFTNLFSPTMMLAFTCELGSFSVPVNTQSLGERLLSSGDGGIVALWAPASISYEIAGLQIASHLFDSIFQQSELRIGDAVKYAFENFDISSGYGFLFKTLEFQGDPATIMASGAYSFDGWREEQFTADDLTNSIVSGWDADPDGDGINNLEEYNGGTNPTNYNERIKLTGGIISEVSGSETNQYISVSFPQAKWSIDVNTYVDMCYDLMNTNWFDATVSFEQVDQEELNAEADLVTLQLFNTNLVERKLFLRTRTEIE